MAIEGASDDESLTGLVIAARFEIWQDLGMDPQSSVEAHGWDLASEPLGDRQQRRPRRRLDPRHDDGADIGRLRTQGRLALRSGVAEAGQVDVGMGVEERHGGKLRRGAHETLIRDLRH